MGTLLGSGDYVYEVDVEWGNLPDGWSYKEVAAVGVDAKDNVYVFTRGEHPMLVFDRQGNFLRSWGEGVFSRAHGVTIGPDESIYCTDDGDHTVRKCTYDGKVLLQLGVPGKAAPFHSGRPFNRCTHVALCPDTGALYVADGYGNSRVHKYSPDGKLLFSWGEPGTDPGQFNIVHNICTDREGYVYVADRENHRVQVFTRDGKFETQWVNMHRPCGLYIDTRGTPLCYVGELGPGMAVNADIPNLGPRVSIYTMQGDLVVRLGDLHGGEAPGQFLAPHGVAVDSHGDIYVGEVSWTVVGRHLQPPREVRSLRKLIRKQ
jgi:DNA-binding beta-propeller fold protein YncE